MRQPAPKKVKPGDEVTAEMWNQLIDLIVRNSIDVGSSPGLNMRQSPGGTALALNQSGQQQYVAVTDGTITARVGTTAGTGQVILQYFDGTDWGDLDTEVDVLNFSSTTGGIPTGTYVWVAQDIDGNYVITAVDCGN